MTGQILVLNAGSSSLKFGVYEAGAEPAPLLRGQVAGIAREARFSAIDARGGTETDAAAPTVRDHAGALRAILDWLGPRPFVAAGHRVVHGGTEFVRPTPLTHAVAGRLAALISLAPHHQPHNLAAIEALFERLPDLPQVACFDTAFHADQPPVASRLGLPLELEKEGLRRYGFHGLSYESVVSRLAADRLPRRLVVAHLGNGASMCAILDGRSIATTMGFSTLDGLAMATRSGSVDPGALLHLLRRGMSASELERLLYDRSGLLGLSGISADMRVLLASDDPRAAAAVEYFCYRVVRETGSLAAALGGLDALAFTGGIGENSAEVRARVCRGLAWLGVELDEARNAAHGPRIGAVGSRVALWVIPSDEELAIARHAAALVGRG